MPKVLDIEKRKQEFITCYYDKSYEEMRKIFNCSGYSIAKYARMFNLNKAMGRPCTRKLVFTDLDSNEYDNTICVYTSRNEFESLYKIKAAKQMF